MKKNNLKKNDLKKIVMMGLAGGVIATSGQAQAEIIESTEATTQIAREGCGTNCSGQKQDMEVARGGCATNSHSCSTAPARNRRYDQIADATTDQSSPYQTRPYSSSTYSQDPYSSTQPQSKYNQNPYSTSSQNPYSTSSSSPTYSQDPYSQSQMQQQSTMKKNPQMMTPSNQSPYNRPGQQRSTDTTNKSNY